MSAEIQIVVAAAVTIHVFILWALLRTQARAERAARQRRRAFNDSLVNRRLK